MKRIGRVLASVWLFMRKGWRRVRLYIMRFAFPQHGQNFIFDPDGYYTHQTIQIGDDVFIGSGAQLSAPESKIVIGNKAMIGPNVTILGGDHNTTEIGKFMFDVKNKLPENDAPVIIEDDVWVGAGVTILKGVRLGRGSIVAAGALVTKDVAPYAIVGGVPSRILRYRFPPETIVVHERLLYEPAERLDIADLIAMQADSTLSSVSS